MSAATQTHTVADDPLVGHAAASEFRVVVSATFTAEPIEPLLVFWLKAMGLPAHVEFAPYNQTLQQLLDPGSELAGNRSGVNLLLVRFEDWVRFKPEGWDEAALSASADDLSQSLMNFAGRSRTPTIVCVTPASPQVRGDARRSDFLDGLEERVRAAIAPVETLHWLGAEALASYPVATPHDEVGDRVGHMPYTPDLLAAVATAVARRVHLTKFPPYKVVALDCDHTLWSGVVGEDGPMGVTLGPGMTALQKFVVAQQEAGMLVCLVSKNAEADVLETFASRPDFPLKREHLVSWRINWMPKSQGLAELAQELNLGLDSFVFLDDNPVECAEVSAALPQVLTVRVPPDGEMAAMLPHLWAFDRLKVTEEDRKRTQMYLQNADRSRLERQAGDIGAFLASLELKIQIAAPTEDQISRVSQLTQRTNQFNFTTIRRSETEIRHLAAQGRECLCVEVDDRFGEYGLVGVLIFAASGDTLAIDTFLLSCRVLGRGVEHAMLAHLGKIAVDRGLTAVAATLVPTPKNEPAANFLKAVASSYALASENGESTSYRIPAEVAAAAAYRPGNDARDQLELARTGGKTAARGKPPSPAFDKTAFHARVAGELRDPRAVLRAIEASAKAARNLDTPIAEPGTALERELAALWRRILQLDSVGVDDEFAALGGTSLQCARLFVEIESHYGIHLPMTTILEAPTVRLLADRMSLASRTGTHESLKLLRQGTPGGPSLFLVHDGDGETLLYLNLARRLSDDVTVYGLEPHGTDVCPMMQTRIPEMAAYYLSRIRDVCPEGPYLLGGLCAGGTIAFEMALQLQRDGQTVGLVALLDAADARAETRPWLGLKRRWARFTNALAGRRDAIQPDAAPREGLDDHVPPAPPNAFGGLGRKVGLAVSKISGVIRYEAAAFARRHHAAAKIRVLRASLAADQEIGNLTGPSVRTVYEHAERSYAPEGRLDAPALLVRAGGDGQDHPRDEPLVARLRDPDFGWSRRLAGGASALEIVDASGGHGGILQEPQVATVADHLQTAINRVLAATLS